MKKKKGEEGNLLKNKIETRMNNRNNEPGNELHLRWYVRYTHPWLKFWIFLVLLRLPYTGQYMLHPILLHGIICLLQRELSSIRFSKCLPAVVRSSRIRRDWYRNTVTFVELTYHDLIDTWKRDIEERFKILLEILWRTLYSFSVIIV